MRGALASALRLDIFDFVCFCWSFVVWFLVWFLFFSKIVRGCLYYYLIVHTHTRYYSALKWTLFGDTFANITHTDKSAKVASDENEWSRSHWHHKQQVSSKIVWVFGVFLGACTQFVIKINILSNNKFRFMCVCVRVKLQTKKDRNQERNNKRINLCHTKSVPLSRCQ